MLQVTRKPSISIGSPGPVKAPDVVPRRASASSVRDAAADAQGEGGGGRAVGEGLSCELPGCGPQVLAQAHGRTSPCPGETPVPGSRLGLEVEREKERFRISAMRLADRVVMSAPRRARATV